MNTKHVCETKEQRKSDAQKELRVKFLENWRKEDPVYTKAVDKFCMTPGNQDEKQAKIVAALLQSKEELASRRKDYLIAILAKDNLYTSDDRRATTVGYDKLLAVISYTLGAR